MKRIFLFVILLTLPAGFYLFKQDVFAHPSLTEAGLRQQILAATVQIRMAAPLEDEAGNPVMAESSGEWHVQNEVAHGLGTLVKDGEQVVIITHNHWGDLLLRAETVEFRNANGAPLAEISGLLFRNLLRYRDQGTLLMKAPPELVPVYGQAVEKGKTSQMVAGGKVFLTRHQAGNRRVEIVEAQVTAVVTKSGILTYRLLSLDGSPVVEGDSGGGLWSEGKLVGNIWWTVVKGSTVTDASGAAAYTESIQESLVSPQPDLLSGGGVRQLP